MDSKQLKQLIKEQFNNALLEKQKGAQKTDISLNGEPYKLVLDVNRNPTKKGIKIQLIPKGDTVLVDPDEKNRR